MKSHRGLSSVVGAVFLIAIVISALSYITYSLEIMGSFSESLIAEESRLKDKQREAFEIISMDVTGANKLDATIKNTGQIPLEIATLWIDEQGVNDVVQKIPIKKTVAPGNSFSFLTEGIDVDALATKGYSLKLVSSRGEVQTFYLNSASQESLDIQLFALPDTIPTKFSTTILMTVVNNMSNNNVLVNLTPNEPLNCASESKCTSATGPFPPYYDLLEHGDTAIFRWVYQLNGNEDDTISFTGSLQNGVPGNTDSETVTIGVPEFADIAGQSITSLGFGQSLINSNLFILHKETYGVPIVPSPPSAIPDPIRNYELNGDATDELGGTDLQLSDGGFGLSPTGWNFLAVDKAQIVADEVPDLEYAIEMVFSFDSANWSRILDYHNHLGGWGYGDADYGLYAANGPVEFWKALDSGGTISDLTLTHVLIQRTAPGIFEMYQDGAIILTINDNIGQTGREEATFRGDSGSQFSSQPATFFKDDGNENSNGFVDCIRVFDEALSSTDANTLTSNSSTCYSFNQAGAAYQISSTAPETPGITVVFDDVTDRVQWFSANVTVQDIDIPAGNWNVTLRYNSPRLPSGMDAGASIIHDTAVGGGGHTLHFNTDTTKARYDSGQMSTCTDLVDSGTLSGATWVALGGVNASGAYFFDGNDYISIANGGVKKSCNYTDQISMSIAGWFNGTITASNNTQTIFSRAHTGNGGFEVTLGDGDAASKGHVIFTFTDVDGDALKCESSGTDYLDEEWHHFVGVYDAAGQDCELFVDGVIEATDSNGAIGHEHEDTAPIYIGMQSGSTNGFTGYIDDIMMWIGYELTSTDTTALLGYSFGANATKMNFFINNATGSGATVDNLATSLNYGLPWRDQMAYTDVNDLWLGANYTVSMPIVGLNLATENRLNFTMDYASGDPLYLRVDDSDMDGQGSNLLSSFIQPPVADGPLPVFYTHDRDNKVSFFAFNAGDTGTWFTFQGTRVIFNGINGHYTGIVDTVSNGVEISTLNATTDSPYIGSAVETDIVFWHPQRIPTTSEPGEPLKIAEGDYNVFIYMNGYDEDGAVFIRNIQLGIIHVVQ